MVDQSAVDIVETTEAHYRLQFRDRERFDELTDAPEWHRGGRNRLRGRDGSDGAPARWRHPAGRECEAPEPTPGREEAKNAAEKIAEGLHPR